MICTLTTKTITRTTAPRAGTEKFVASNGPNARPTTHLKRWAADYKALNAILKKGLNLNAAM